MESRLWRKFGGGGTMNHNSSATKYHFVENPPLPFRDYYSFNDVIFFILLIKKMHIHSLLYSLLNVLLIARWLYTKFIIFWLKEVFLQSINPGEKIGRLDYHYWISRHLEEGLIIVSRLTKPLYKSKYILFSAVV